MLPDDLPQDSLEFNARFGTDEQCREYLFQARWPDGFRCDGCGHGDVYALRTRLVHECAACGKQHSLLAGTLFEQTKTGLARWFLAVYLVTSSKGGIAAAGLQSAYKWLSIDANRNNESNSYSEIENIVLSSRSFLHLSTFYLLREP